MRFALFSALFATLACGDDDRPADVGRSDSGPVDSGLDAPGLDAADAGLEAGLDAGLDATDAGSFSCTAPRLDETFDVLPAGASTLQIHPAVVFDGERLWVTTTVREGETSRFDVALSSIDCAGVPSDVQIVNGSEGEVSDLDSVIALSGSSLLVAWQADDGSGTIGTRVRPYDADGAALGAPSVVQTMRDGALHDGTLWMPSLAPREGGFWLVGSRGVESLSGFIVYAQPLGPMGAPDGEATEPGLEIGVTQVDPVARSEGSLRVGFTRDGDAVQVFAGDVGDGLRLAPNDTIEARNPSLGADYVAFTALGSGQSRVAYASFDGLVRGAFGAVGQRNAAPVVADGEGGSAVVWLRNIAGLRNEILVRRVETGARFTFGDEVAIPTERPVYPYPPVLVSLRAQLYFVAWVEGTSPDLIVRGRFIDLG